jgi:acetoin utilization deacetylase AcuC-like enzyme
MMGKTAVVFSPKYYEHDPGKDHPESAKRLEAIIHELKNGLLSQNRDIQFVDPFRASIEDVELVHGIEYIRLVEAVCNSGGGLLDLEDTVVSSQTYEVALSAVGGAIRSVDLAMNGKYQNAFALVRPPGHHASRFRACGFCVFNNVAIAAEHLRRHYKLRRIAILDFDAHHGNGTQETFYSTDEVLYISLHEDPTGFPGTGFPEEVGEGEGLGFTINIPFPYETSDRIYLKALREIVEPIIRQYRPQFVLVSAGLDGHRSDPVGNLSLSTACYSDMFRTITGLANHLCHGRLVSVLEGGYNVNHVGKTCASAIAEMSGHGRICQRRKATESSENEEQGEAAIQEVKKVQRAFWHVD